MANTIHVFDYLQKPQDHPPQPVCVVFGDEPFLKRLAISELRSQLFGDDDPPFATFDGTTAEWRDVADELCTVALFGGGGQRVAVVEDADDFVKQHRDRLEAYSERPKSKSVLILVASTWAANTRIYKLLDKTGLQIDGRAPFKTVGRRKVVDESAVLKWMSVRARTPHGVRLSGEAAQILLDIRGTSFGLLDQELSKLSLYLEPGEEVTPDMVRDIVGGWKTKSVWDLKDLACDGSIALALKELDHLLQGGEPPQAMFGQISWWLRRYAVATRIYQRAERSGKRIPLRRALEQAGFRDWPQGTLARAEKQLIRIGRHRAARLYRGLLEADLAMKLSHSAPHRARFVLERLLLRLSSGIPANAGCV